MRRLIFGLLLMAMACGQPQAQPATSPLAVVTTPSSTATAAPSPTFSPSASRSPSAKPSPKPSPLPKPSTSPSLLFAVLEAKATANPEQWNTVAIAGLDGYARAKTTFVPMPVPSLGCSNARLPTSAHVAASRVYFADGAGVVRSLSASGQVTPVVTFPLTSRQQMLSFAVNPDGSQLLGAIFTLPLKPQLGCSGGPVLTGYGLDVYSAQPGGASTLLYHESLPALDKTRIDLGINVMAFVGWDRVGPIATHPTSWVRGCCSLPNPFDGGTPVRVDANTGKVLRQVSTGTCYVQDIALSGDFLCKVGTDNRLLSVRRPDGSEIWRAAGGANHWILLVSFLSPDERRLVAPMHTSVDTAEVAGKDGGRVAVAGEFWPRGWLDSATVIGNGSGQNLSYVSLSAPLIKVDMGFDGLFIGTVHP